ncbi:MAG: hypothetical protein ACYTBJ_02160 [Planctomycetota bacterium]|jgi:hypothetical protein
MSRETCQIESTEQRIRDTRDELGSVKAEGNYRVDTAIDVFLDTRADVIPKHPLQKGCTTLLAGRMLATADTCTLIARAAEGHEAESINIYTSRHGAFSAAILIGLMCQWDEDIMGFIWLKWKDEGGEIDPAVPNRHEGKKGAK